MNQQKAKCSQEGEANESPGASLGSQQAANYTWSFDLLECSMTQICGRLFVNRVCNPRHVGLFRNIEPARLCRS